MRKQLFLIMSILLMAFTITGCVTMNMPEYGRNYVTHEPIKIEDENVKAELSFMNDEWVNLTIINKSKDVIQLINDLSSYNDDRGNNSKLIPEGTKYIDANNSIPPIAIPPESMYKKNYISSNHIYYESGQYGGWRTKPWVPNSLKKVSFIFTYKVNGMEKYLLFKGENTNEVLKEPEMLGTIDVHERYWNVLFLKSVNERRSLLYTKALIEAKKKYGDNITLKNLQYIGEWHPLSLVLYFSMLGFVEDASLTADVYNN